MPSSRRRPPMPKARAWQRHSTWRCIRRIWALRGLGGRRCWKWRRSPRRPARERCRCSMPCRHRMPPLNRAAGICASPTSALPAARSGYKGGCQPRGLVLRRSLVHLSTSSPVQAFDHHIHCQLDANTAHALTVEIEDGPDQYQAALAFTTTAAEDGPRLRVQQTQELSRDDVNRLFRRYVEDALVDDIESRLARRAAAELVDQLARRTWRDLRSPGAAHGVVAQRVSYVSRTPSGARSDAVTGLVAVPNAPEQGFEARDRIVILSHATGSTPSALRFSDTWFVLAAMLAGRGFVVVAADNWGRGEGTSDQPETYLMGHRTAANSLDLVRAVLADPAYRRFQPEREAGQRADAAIFGYSQGGHSAFALWLAAQTSAAPINVRELHVGGAPFDLHRTLRGTLQAVAGQCDGNPWCRYVGRVGGALCDRAHPAGLPGLREHWPDARGRGRRRCAARGLRGRHVGRGCSFRRAQGAAAAQLLHELGRARRHRLGHGDSPLPLAVRPPGSTPERGARGAGAGPALPTWPSTAASAARASTRRCSSSPPESACCTPSAAWRSPTKCCRRCADPRARRVRSASKRGSTCRS